METQQKDPVIRLYPTDSGVRGSYCPACRAHFDPELWQDKRAFRKAGLYSENGATRHTCPESRAAALPVLLYIEDDETGETETITDPARAFAVLLRWHQDSTRRIASLERAVRDASVMANGGY